MEQTRLYSRLNKLSQITPVILTYNEEANLERTLARLQWATEIIVVDSFSTDRTRAIAGNYLNVKFGPRVFDDHTQQWNFGLEQAKTEWVLALDADYVLSPELVEELKAFEANSSDATINAFYARFRYCYHGKPLVGTLYPPRAVLFRKGKCTYQPDGHTQLLKITGETGFLRSFIDHDDRKPLDRWLQAQTRYAKLEGAKLTGALWKDLPIQDRLRKRLLGAPLVFFYTLLWKGLIFDGWKGWFYVLQRTYAELLIALYLIDARLSRR